MLNLSVDLINFDPDILDVIVSYLAVACKYAMFIALVSIGIRMIIRAFKGKENFI